MEIFETKVSWKSRSIPCVVPIQHKLQKSNKLLFRYTHPLKIGPLKSPWKLASVQTSCFPVSKKDATNNNTLVKNTFRDILAKLPDENFIAFTDGSHNPESHFMCLCPE